LLDLLNLRQCRVERGGHRGMHFFGLVALDIERCPAVAAKELVELVAWDAG
jgi:hypothetical protein